MITSKSNDGSGQESQIATSGKRRKSLILVVLVLAIILILSVIGLVLLQEKHFDFTSFEGTSITTSHTESGEFTTTYHWQWINREMYKVGEPMDFWFRSYNPGDGALILVGAASNLTGFTFTGSNPPLPLTIPNTSDPNQGAVVTLRFDTPSTGYNGPFRFNIYYDWYPSPPTPPGQKNNITSVTETQIISVHAAGGTSTQTYVIHHPEFAGKYVTGALMTLSEPFRYTGAGRMNLSSIATDTPAFSLVSSTPPLPLIIPNATQPWLSITMMFDVPSYQYNGSFNYTVHLDQYPEWVEPSYHLLTSVLEVQYVTTHFGSANNTVKYLRWHNDTAGLYQVGKPINITEPFWNIASGNMSITSIVANTTEFTLIGTDPSLPVSVPNSPDAIHGNVTVVISFQAPTIQYIGHLEYTVYFDEYLIW